MPSPKSGNDFCRSLITLLLCGTGLFWPLSLRADNVTFCYHQFEYSLGNVYAELPDVFEWQIRYIQSQGIGFSTLANMEAMYTAPAKAMPPNVFLTVDDGWKNFKMVLPFVVKEHLPITLFIYPSVINRDPDYFSNKDLTYLRDFSWIDFGCHSDTHIVLRKCPELVLDRELITSRTILDKMLGRKLEVFAYPFGMYDHATKVMVRKNYTLAFGVNDGSNNPDTDRYNLNRYVVYKTTSFGEFMNEVDHVQGKARKPAYRVIPLELGRGTDKYFIFTKVRLFEFAAEEKKRALVIIPSSFVGAGWLHKLIARSAPAHLQVYAMVNRNNNIPFYRPIKEMRDLVTWGMKEYQEDLEHTLDYILAQEKSIEILTWGDGMDLLMSVLASSPKYHAAISKIYVVNPSFLSEGKEPEAFLKEREACDQMLAQGQYTTPKLAFFLKMKTLADLMILKPAGPSPFAQQLGYDPVSNRELFLAEMDKAAHPLLGLPSQPTEKEIQDFNQAFMQPLPVLSMVVPIRWLRDLNDLWHADFQQPESGMVLRKEVKLPVECFYSENFSGNLLRLETTFPGLKIDKRVFPKNPSTVEMLLSDALVEQIAGPSEVLPVTAQNTQTPEHK